MGQRSRTPASCLVLLWTCAACASLPHGHYGVKEVGWTGVNAVSEEAIEACLVTRAREASTLSLGLGSTKCGVPPFDSDPPTLTLWTLPWVEWPVYDPAIFDLDKERIQRWYRARGYYDAHVLGVKTYADDRMITDPIECDPEKSSCELQVMVELQEGEPVRVRDVQVESKTLLPADVLADIEAVLSVKRGEVFDESDYEADKAAIQPLLWNASYARATVTGRVSVDREQRSARVVYQLEPGPPCVFGTLRVEGADDLPLQLIVQAADIKEGKAFSYEDLLDAEQAVFALGVFSSVQIKPQGEGSRVDLVASVRVGRHERWSGGFGLMSGTLVRSFEQESIPQWDIHLVGAYENKSFLGGMRRLRLEERPRIIMLNDFPRVPASGPRPGNVLSVRFEQPAAFERRTTFFFENTWDYGPDAFDGYFRHDLGTKVGFSRPFWRQRFQAQLAVGHDFYEVTDDEMPDTVSSYRLPFLEQQLTLDLRNDAQRPKWGLYIAVLVQEAFRLGGYGSWNYIRVTPDVRGYVPLMWDFVLAARFAVGALFIGDREASLDDVSARLGPQTYRLRGGGSTSNRGFSPGTLGDAPGLDRGESHVGGIRRWESSLELRIPFGEDLGMALFGDVGDVNQGSELRFSHLNTALGFGFRYFTILGAIRFDAGWRIPGWQVIGGSAEDNEVSVSAWPSAAHLTIGEAF